MRFVDYAVIRCSICGMLRLTRFTMLSWCSVCELCTPRLCTTLRVSNATSTVSTRLPQTVAEKISEFGFSY